jgi:hypothetical protein
MDRPERASPEEEQGAAFTAALRRADLTLEQLWTRYFALGGDADLMDVDAHLAGLLAALVELLTAAGSAPPERLAATAATAGRALGVEVSIYLIDHEQRGLVHLPAAGPRASPPLGLEGTLAGRAFRTLRILSSDRASRPRLWVPLVDGADRLGVLEAQLNEPAELYDPVLREQLTWMSSLLGHLIASMGD